MAKHKLRVPTGLKIKKARIGKGIFTKKSYQAQSTIFEIKGKVVTPEKLEALGGTIQDNAFRSGKNSYLSPQSELGDFQNHSCAPNCKVVKKKGKLYIVAVRDIPAREEITIDYSTILGNDDIWEMNCGCGNRSCRKLIRKFGSLPKRTKKLYLSLNMVPSYIQDTL